MSFPDSACIERARRSLCLQLRAGESPPLRTLTFATRSGSDAESWRALKARGQRGPAGEIGYATAGRRDDPVKSYLLVSLRGGLVLEAMELSAEPGKLQVFRRREKLGCVVEGKPPQPSGFCRRLLGGTRQWDVFLFDKLLGRIDLVYPVSKSSRLFLRLADGGSLPIGVATVWGRRETQLVIPSDSPDLEDGDLETMHFLLGVAFRTLFLQLDFATGS